MLNITDKSKCNGCHACKNICPQNCINMEYDHEGFLYPSIFVDNCVNCGLCEKICPVLNPRDIENHESIAFACKNKDEAIRKISSSGGIFSVIANSVLEKGGVVFGAAFDDEFKVIHKYVEDFQSLQTLFGSKYVQSKIGTCYIQTKNFLEQGRLVLFTGTPCQVGGLLSYLKKPYDNLITQDIICHGVPSPIVWEKYLKFKLSKKKQKIKKVCFRSKINGWKRYSLQFTFDNKETDCEIQGNDPYMKAFFKSVSLRPSCFNCSFKSKNRNSDMTLADLWGIENIAPEIDDNKGISLVILHSPKGKALFKKLKEKILFKEIDLNLAIEFNPCMIRSVKKSPKREKFLLEINENNFDKITQKYCKESLLFRIRRKLKSIKLFGLK